MRRIQHKLPYSRDHLVAALHLARAAYDVEVAWRRLNVGPGDPVVHVEGTSPFHPSDTYRANVVGSIMASVACVEANINEFFSNARDGIISSSEDRSEEAVQRAGHLWETRGVSRLGTLEKYQIALATLDLPRFQSDRQPYQDVRLVIEFRNSLVHFEPELQEAGAMDRNLERRLAGKFPLNPIASDALFPYYLLSFGAARWAASAAFAFVREFRTRMGDGFSPPRIIQELEWLSTCSPETAT